MTVDRELPKIRKALERIADGIERYADADPMTVLHEALQGAEGVTGEPDHPLVPNVEPQGPFASNGATAVYRHPDPAWQIVLRRDSSEESGYYVVIEPAQ